MYDLNRMILEYCQSYMKTFGEIEYVFNYELEDQTNDISYWNKERAKLTKAKGHYRELFMMRTLPQRLCGKTLVTFDP